MHENTGFLVILDSARLLYGPNRLFFTPLRELQTYYAG